MGIVEGGELAKARVVIPVGGADFNTPMRMIDMGESRKLNGPWGVIEASPITIQAPTPMCIFNASDRSDLIWNLSVSNRADVKLLLEESGLGRIQVEELLSRALWNNDSIQWTIKPTPDFAFELNPAIRGRLFSRLSRFANNERISYPLVYYQGEVAGWIDGGNLRPETIALMKKLLYPKTGGVALSDFELLLSRMTDPREVVQLRKTLSRTRSLALTIAIGYHEDIEGVADYWGVGDHRFLVEPRLRAVSLKSGGGNLDVIHLLPRFARSRLDTFAYRGEYVAGKGLEYDCIWTAMNFFNEVPDVRFATGNRVELAESMSVEIPAPTQFGDLVFLLDKKKLNVLHSCNYIGANIVFTKNGNTPFAPFVFAYIQDVLDIYGIADAADVVYRRLSNSGPTQDFKMVAVDGEQVSSEFVSLAQ